MVLVLGTFPYVSSLPVAARGASRPAAVALRHLGTKTGGQNTRRAAPFVFGALAAAALGASTVFADAKTDSKIGDYGAVKAAIADILDNGDWDDGSLGPVLVRLAWHASGVSDWKPCRVLGPLFLTTGTLNSRPTTRRPRLAVPRAAP